MQVIYDDTSATWIEIKSERIAAFLCAQGVSKKRVSQFSIHLCGRIPERFHNEQSPCNRDTWGLHSVRERAIYLAVDVHQLDLSALNTTLLHELCHYIKKGYRPGEILLPYRERPSEVEARAFAEKYAATHRFVGLDPVVKNRLVALAAGAVVTVVLAAFVLVKQLNKGVQ